MKSKARWKSYGKMLHEKPRYYVRTKKLNDVKLKRSKLSCRCGADADVNKGSHAN